MLCPLCGNDLFESLDSQCDQPMDVAPDNLKMRCSDCNSIYTKEELIERNQEILENAVKDIEEDAIKEIEKELKKVIKKWKF